MMEVWWLGRGRWSGMMESWEVGAHDEEVGRGIMGTGMMVGGWMVIIIR